MTPVEERLRRRIALAGPLTVADYMTACLTDPDGYYAQRDPFGAAGDFITAPEISQMFGELVGAFMVACWRADGRPDAFDLVELGPGRGTLMADVLRVAAHEARFFEAARVVLVEASPRLRQLQRERLAPVAPSLTFADAVPNARPIYLLANEFFDALPIRQFVARGGRWFERTVGLHDDRLAFGLNPFPAPLATPAAADGAVLEISPAAETMAASIARALRAQGAGVALVVDYGDAGTGHAETLQAVRAHEHVGVLERPGEADLSAHVNFARLAETGRAAGAHPHGPVTQGAFLIALGLLERAGQLGANADEHQRRAIEAAVQRLAGDGEGEMGTLFKALALTARDAQPPGFSVVSAPHGC